MRIFCLNHDLVCLEQSLLACLNLFVCLSIYFIDCLFVKTRKQTHELFITIHFLVTLSAVFQLLGLRSCGGGMLELWN